MEENNNNLQNENVQSENVQSENNNQINASNNSEQQLMPVKNNNGLIGFLVIIIILLMIGLVYVLFFNKKEEKGNDNPQVTPTPTVIPQGNEGQEEPQGDYELVVYLSKWGDFSTIEDDSSEKIVVKTTNANAKYVAGNTYGRFFLYDDGGLKIYDYKTKNIVSINLNNNLNNYILFLNEDADKVIGISYVDDNSMSGFYNVLNQKEMYTNKYKYDDYEGFISVINDNRLSVYSNKVSYLLDINTEKVISSYNSDDTMIYDSYGKNGSYIYALKQCYDECVIRHLYSNKLEEIKIDIKDLYDGDFNVYNGYLYIPNGKTVKKFNTNGELISQNEEFGEVKGIINNYVIYIKDNKLILENYDNNIESIVLKEGVNNIIYDEISKYYTRDDLDRRDEANKKEGLYVVVYYGYKDDENGGMIQDENGYFGIEYCYTPDKQLIKYPIKQEMGGRAKPVLYLYPEKETNVTVKFAKPELLTTTYPKYINSWNVTVKPNGDMYDKDGKYYYALYWDEKRYNEVDFKEGFYVEGKDAISFLEEKLAYIGLNDKERNEFIMYWLPIMETNKKNLVYFELTNERELGNKLIITPKPDSLLRVNIHIKKVNEKVNIKEQKLEPFTRVGFTAVEWGGMTY